MGLLNKLFGKKQSTNLFESVASIIAITHSTCVFGDTMQHPQKRKIVLCYYLGFVDFLGQTYNVTKDEIIEVMGQVLRNVLNINGEEYVKAVKCIIEASQEPEGRQYIKEGATALADFLDKNTQTASLPLTSLLKEV